MTKLGKKLIKAAKEVQLCEDEGCPHYGTPHVCLSEWQKKELADNPNHPTNTYIGGYRYADKPVEWAGCFVTDPVHGGKVTCHKCNGFIQEKELFTFRGEMTRVQFHEDCFNRYEHYYGLDKPLD